MRDSHAYNATIDTLRVLAIFAVILIHFNPLKGQDGSLPALGLWLDAACRFAVPFFFVVSGYFFGQKLRTSPNIWQPTTRFTLRVMAIFAFWCVFYLLAPSQDALATPALWWPEVQQRIHSAVGSPLRLALFGTHTHLWFLSSLASGCVAAALLIRSGSHRLEYLCAAGLLVLGLAGQGFSQFWAPQDWSYNVTRSAVFLSAPCFLLGRWVAADMLPKTLSQSVEPWLLVAAGFALQWAEAWLLPDAAGNANYYAGSVLAALGLLLAALRSPGLGRNSVLPKLGRLTLGIYGVHFFVLACFLTILGSTPHTIAALAVPLVCLLLSACIAWCAKQVPVLAPYF